MENIEDDVIDKLSHLSLDDLNYILPIGSTGGPSGIPSDSVLNEPSNAIMPSKGTKKYYDRYYNNTYNNKSFTGKDKYNPCSKKEEPIYRGGTKLNLNCSDNRKEDLYIWGRNMELFFLGNDEENWDRNRKIEFLLASFEGITRDYWNGLDEETKSLIKRNTEVDFVQSDHKGIQKLILYLASEFIGEEWIRHSETEHQREIIMARNNLINLQICNMCYIKQYINEFSEYFYKQYSSLTSQQILLEMFYDKLPYPWNIYFKKEYHIFIALPDQSGILDTLGGRIRFLLNRLSEICLSRKLMNKSKAVSHICCEKLNIPSQWGCTNINSFKRKRNSTKIYKKRKFFKRNINKYKHPNKRIKIYKRKKNYTKIHQNKSKKSKLQNCKCWNCGEIGHLSPDCPKKKVQILEVDFNTIYSDLESISNISDISENESIIIKELTSSSESEFSNSE